jgi:hypothetical protein
MAEFENKGCSEHAYTGEMASLVEQLFQKSSLYHHRLPTLPGLSLKTDEAAS